MPTREDLKSLQAMPLDWKIITTEQRIHEWVYRYGESGCYVSFSGGKDSTVLLHLVRKLYPNIKAVFSDTGLEFPEIRQFVKSIDNVDWIKPKQTFREIVISKGYPLFSKEVAESIWFARKIIGGYLSDTSERNFTSTQTNCRRKKIQGVFRRASRKGQVNF